MCLTVTDINKVVSPELGIHRKTLIRQLEEMAAESLLPSSEQNPYIRVRAVGEKKKGPSNQRYFIITFKQKSLPAHVRRYYESITSSSVGERAPSSVKQVFAAYEHETERLEEGCAVRRLRGKDLTRRTGLKIRTVRWAQKRLRDEERLEADKTQEPHKRDVHYYHDGVKGDVKYRVTRNRCRTTYRAKEISSVGVIAQNCTLNHKSNHLTGKIVDFTKGSLNSAQASEAANTSLPEPSQKISPYQKAWARYSEIFTPKEGESLRQSLGAAKKYGVKVPTPERLMEALERSKDVPYLKLARRVGFLEAEKAELLARGGSLNDSSVHWKKDFIGKHSRLGFLWILKHAEEILAGKYDRRELSERAKGLACGEDGEYPAPNTPVKRGEIPAEWFKLRLQGLAKQKDLRELLERLWDKYGWSTYETLLDPCKPVQDAQGRWVFEAPNGHHADLMESRLSLEWWRIVRPKIDRKACSPLREAYTAWFKENAQNVQKEQKDEESERDGRIVTDKGEEKMVFVPGNDDEGVIPYWTDKERSATKARKDHRSRRTASEDLEASGRESEEEILRERSERQESALGFLKECRNIHPAEKALRIKTITQHGIGAYQCWFNLCQVEIAGDVARYVAPSDFIGYEIERRYGVILESYTAKADD